MKGLVAQEKLAKGLSVVGRAVSSRTTMPILSNILLEFGNGMLRLAATNREIGINCWIPADIEDDGAITVPAKLLSEFVASLPPEKVELDLTEKTQSLGLTCGKFKSNIKGIDAFEFPVVGGELPAGCAEFDLSPKGLKQAIEQVVFAASTDENRPTLTGVEVVLHEQYFKMAATDGYRLSVRKLGIETVVEEKIIAVIPAKSLAEVSRISSDAAEDESIKFALSAGRNQAIVEMIGKDSKDGFVKVQIVSELIDARFPDYMATVPKEWKTKATVDTASLLKAAKIGLMFARDNANIVRVNIDGTQGQEVLQLSASSAELGDNASDLAIKMEGEHIEIAFNAKYLIDYLSHVDTPQTVIELTQPTRPGMFYSPGKKDEYFHVTMPMHSPKR